MEDQTSARDNFYTARLTVEVFTYGKQECDAIMEVIASAVECVESEYPRTAITVVTEEQRMTAGGMRALLSLRGLDAQEVSL